MTGYPKELIADLLQGRLSSEDLGELQRQEKDRDRFDQISQIEQERLRLEMVQGKGIPRNLDLWRAKQANRQASRAVIH